MKGRKSSKESKNILDEHQKTIEKIGARIKALRIERGNPSSELFAYENEIDRTQYQRYERGADMRMSSLLRVLKALNISLEDFFSEGFK